MGLERTICCCGASTYTKYFAWIQIIVNAITFIAAIVNLVVIIALNYGLSTVDGVANSEEGNLRIGELQKLQEWEKKSQRWRHPNIDATEWAVFAISIILPFLGIVMGIILLKGTNQKRVAYLRAWLIYGGFALAVSIISFILKSISTTTDTITTSVASGFIGVALNIFAVVVYILIKEINEGVFELHHMQPVTKTM